MTWSKLIEESNTSFNIAARRFSTENYMSLREAASLNSNVKRHDNASQQEYSRFQRMKTSSVNVSQPVSLGNPAAAISM